VAAAKAAPLTDKKCRRVTADESDFVLDIRKLLDQSHYFAILPG
jgi:hypothetical protein